MNAEQRLEAVSTKVSKMSFDIQANLFHPQVTLAIKKMIVSAEKEGKDSVSIEDLLKVYEDNAK